MAVFVLVKDALPVYNELGETTSQTCFHRALVTFSAPGQVPRLVVPLNRELTEQTRRRRLTNENVAKQKLGLAKQ